MQLIYKDSKGHEIIASCGCIGDIHDICIFKAGRFLADDAEFRKRRDFFPLLFPI